MKQLLLSILLFSSLLSATNLKVMVIDTGLDFNNPELTKHVPKELLKDNKYIYIHHDNDGHGSHVTGIITENICPEVDIVACKFYGPEHTTIINTIRCIDWAYNLGINIINYSAGGPDSAKQEKQAISRFTNAGGIFVSSAGNYGEDLRTHPYYPASYNLKNLIVVGSVDTNGDKSDFSNWGIPMYWEHGENVLSWLLNGKKAYKSGTSQSAAKYTNSLVKHWCKAP